MKRDNTIPEETPGLKPRPTYVFPFETLDVYQMAVDFADYVLGLLGRIPLNKHFRLISQTEGAVVSVSQNIAEGKGRFSKKEFIQFLYISRGSLFETITLLEIFRRRKWIGDSDFASLKMKAIQLGKRINSLINSLKR